MYKIMLIIVSLITNSVVLANCSFECSDEGGHAYIGTNISVHHMEYKKGYGHNFLRHNLPMVSIYSGLNVNRFIALELGYDKSINREKFSVLGKGDFVAGTPIPNTFDSAVFRGKLKLQGPYLSIVRFYSNSDGSRMKFLASAGMSFLKGKAHRQIICVNNQSFCGIRYLKEDKFIPRISVGIQYMITNILSTRGIIGWQNTSKLKFYPCDDRCAYFYPEIKPKDTITYGLGLLWAF